MSELLVLLEDLGIRGSEAAERHFQGLITAIRAAFPEPLWVDAPPSRAEVSGMFTASTKHVYVQVLKNLPDYEQLTAVFNYEAEVWTLEKFVLSFGFMGPSYTAYNLRDAVLLSRLAVTMRSKALASDLVENPQSASVM